MFTNRTLFRENPVLPVVMITLSALIGNFALPGTTLASTITVNSTADVAANDGQCTLREAIISVNSSAASGTSAGECGAGGLFDIDTIAFNIGIGGAQTITLGSLLPPITSPVNIDGTTQPSYAPGKGMIRVDAGGLYTSVLSLEAGSTGSSVKGMMITRGATYGIIASSDSNNNTFQSNYIGTDGSSALPSGAGLSLGGTNNVVGGTAPGTGNLISGAWNNDVYLGASGNLVQGNIIGTDATGTTSLSTGGVGVYVNGANNMIGGTDFGAGNLISGETYGIVFSIDAATNTVQGNKIGTNLAGSAAVTGSGTGVYIWNQPRNIIGGSMSGAGNLISGNATNGIFIEGNPAYLTVIQGNYIGTNAAGTVAIPNGRGILLSSAMGTIVGGSSSGEGNLVSGNTNEGIWVAGVNSTPNTVQGNRIGTNAAGTSALPNNIGLRVSSGNNTVGGAATGAGNLISGNTAKGVSLDGGATGNILRGNFIGTNTAGNSAIPNGNGIVIDTAPNTTIGGGSAGQGNLVSGNTNIGIQISSSTGHVVTGNKIGTDAVGSGSLSNGAAGIFLTFSASALVNQNLIAHHGGSGDFGIILNSSALFAAGSIDNCVIYNATGVQNSTGSSRTFTNNWWGHPSGPSGAGPGSGDIVSTNVVFAPWLTVPPAACEPVLTVSLSGTGAGTVTSNPQGINPVGITCTSGVCSTTFPYNTLVELTASADNVSTFDIWGGECSGSGACSITMTGPKAVSASFMLAPKARIVNIGFTSLYDAYKTAISGDIIMTIDSEMPDKGLNIDAALARGKAVTINGGYYADYSGRSGLPTYLKGPLYISSGTLTVVRLSIH